MKRRKQKLTLHLPDEFLDLCQQDLIEPEFVLRGFIADLCGIMSWQSNPRTDGYCSNGSDERQFAHDYYERVGYPYWACFKRDAEQPKSPSNRAANLNCRDRQFNLTPDSLAPCEIRSLLAGEVRRLSEQDEALVRHAVLQAPALFCSLLPGEILANEFHFSLVSGHLKGRVMLTGPQVGMCLREDGEPLDLVFILMNHGRLLPYLARLANLITGS